MKLCQLWTPKDGARVGVVDGDRVIDITSRSTGVTSYPAARAASSSK